MLKRAEAALNNPDKTVKQHETARRMKALLLSRRDPKSVSTALGKTESTRMQEERLTDLHGQTNQSEPPKNHQNFVHRIGFRLNDTAYPGGMFGAGFSGMLAITLGYSPNLPTVLLCIAVGAYIGHKWPKSKD
jgi:hypothetical protein